MLFAQGFVYLFSALRRSFNIGGGAEWTLSVEEVAKCELPVFSDMKYANCRQRWPSFFATDFSQCFCSVVKLKDTFATRHF